MNSKWIWCEQCGIEFEFQAEDQERYAMKGYDDPIRCSDCRKHKNRPFILDSEQRKLRNRKKYIRERYENLY